VSISTLLTFDSANAAVFAWSFVDQTLPYENIPEAYASGYFTTNSAGSIIEDVDANGARIGFSGTLLFFPGGAGTTAVRRSTLNFLEQKPDGTWDVTDFPVGSYRILAGSTLFTAQPIGFMTPFGTGCGCVKMNFISGAVEIGSLIVTPVPEPSTWVMMLLGFAGWLRVSTEVKASIDGHLIHDNQV
jgi:hypothetical protein